MAIDPQLLAYYRRLAERYANAPAPADIPAQRARFAEIAAASLLPDPAGITVQDLELALSGRSLGARLFRPAGETAPRLVVYFHGGGWVIGSPQTHHTVAALLAADTGCAVASVDYRLAPEHAFPAPCDDASEAVQWFAGERQALGLATDFLAVAGDSAGGHLAAQAAQQLNGGGAVQVDAQLLIYPVTAPVLSTESYRAFADGPGLTRDEMAWFWTQFIGAEALAEGTAHPDHRVHLMAAPLVRPPATVLMVAAHDVLRDDGLAYADFLVRHDALVVTIEASGMTHGFARLQPDAERAREWMRRAAAAFTGMIDDV
ncbi:alpha/beta hydrolase [Cupriavidus necator]|uniref:alpha/beta hydrolase n=1 Tax=Cupriavidus TaxID=106589 RepID=UPI0003302333|nr:MULTISPECIES: alpha/beta hydrolase [Cupriavidus]EON19254.1 esterase [Cupriavidus sp. GA3-3]KUE86640.1 alpha/beta hydrolase [Cupriavidus necator]